MILNLAPVPADRVRGIYTIGGVAGRMSPRACYLAPGAAKSFTGMLEVVVVSDMLPAPANRGGSLNNLAAIRTIRQLERAALARSMRITYSLGRGGRDPEAASPADARGRLDCSGLTCWIDEIDRRQLLNAPRGVDPDAWVDMDGDGDLDPAMERWLGTSGIMNDAIGPMHWYEPIDRPELGCLVVYAADPKAGRSYGHVEMVTGGLPAEWIAGKVPEALEQWRRLRLTGCRGPNGNVPAVKERDGLVFYKHLGKRRGTMFVRRVG